LGQLHLLLLLFLFPLLDLDLVPAPLVIVHDLDLSPQIRLVHGPHTLLCLLVPGVHAPSPRIHLGMLVVVAVVGMGGAVVKGNHRTDRRVVVGEGEEEGSHHRDRRGISEEEVVVVGV
jgi:hypothetical protein